MPEYTVIRSGRKTLSLQINKNCEIIVRAPYGYSDKKIRAFLEEHRQWIDEALEKQSTRNEGRVSLDDGDIAFLKKLAQKTLPARAEYYSRLMGVKPESIKITSAQSRFGSCSGKNGICFSYMLMLYPSEAIDYVVVHELAHIKEHNHSRAFYAVIASVMPDYRQREELLKGPQKMPDRE